MKLNLSRLGEYIEQSDLRNRDKKITCLKGISTSKKFIESKANMTGVNISPYKVVKNGEFAYVSDTSRRGDKIALAFNDDEPYIVSSIYTVFKIKENCELLPEYLFIWFNRKEFDRYARYHSWGSARETFDWNSMCDVKIPVPHIDEQKKYVEIYTGYLQQQKCYESSLYDLQLICNSYLDSLIKSETHKKLGPYIKQLEERNTDLQSRNVLGISVNKVFIPSRANRKDLNVSNYKVVRQNQFGYVSVTSRNGEKISIALLDGPTGVISSSYISFKIEKNTQLLPEFLYLWFTRPEFDRYTRFHSWGSARETFAWKDMCNIYLPIPSINQQKSIVEIHHVLESRKDINKKLKEAIQKICPVLIKDSMNKVKCD
jgi:type I restriction enzyme S subunit